MYSLAQLIELTESLFHEIALNIHTYKGDLKPSIPHIDPSVYKGRYAQLEFIPTLEREIHTYIPNWTCPDLSKPDTALAALLATFKPLHLNIPAARTLPTLLDALAAHLIEPLCVAPTFIIHHPECMSPLAKSFTQDASPTNGVRHRVAARAELFINAREYVNCYEEENSPVAQRRKFVEQLRFREQGGKEGEDALGTDREVDESYLAALEWGMPPTGGWGCGVDRIVMLFSGRGRIADVLPFGTLRNVVGLGSKGVKRTIEVEKANVADRQGDDVELRPTEEKTTTLEKAWKSGLEA